MLRRRGGPDSNIITNNMSDHPAGEPTATDYDRDIETGDGGAAAEGQPSPLKMVAESTPLEKLAGLLAAISVGLALGAMIIQGGAIVTVTGILTCLVGPLAYYQQTRLTDIRTLIETHEALQREVDRLTVENERLAKSVEELTTTVDKLEETEKALDAITETQGQSVTAFQDQVKQNREILDKMTQNLRANALQNVISILIRSDTDGDFHIDDAEIDDLIARMERLNGVDINDNAVRKVIKQHNGDINALMEILKDVMNKDPKERTHEKLFTVKDEEEEKQ